MTDDRTEKTLILDVLEKLHTVTIQQGTIQGSVNILVSNHARAEEDRREIKEQVSKINGRIRALETARDQAVGAALAIRTLWVMLGAAMVWLAKKAGLI